MTPLDRQYPHFAAWLRGLGTSQQAQADAIGCTQRAVGYWWLTQRAPTIEALALRPDGLEEIVKDLRERRR